MGLSLAAYAAKREAERQLPVQVDPAAHADALEQLGLNPQNLLDDDAADLEDKLDPDGLRRRLLAC